jgi:hypothetical protein
MKMRFAVAAAVVLIASSGAAQSVCRQAATVAVQRQEELTIFSVVAFARRHCSSQGADTQHS